MANEPNVMRDVILRRLRTEQENEVTLANNLLSEMTRYILQMHSLAEEETRMHSLPLDQPHNFYGLHTLLMSSESDTRITTALEAAREEVMRSINEKQELINNYRAICKKKQAEVSRQEVSNSNSFDALNSIENDDHLGMNGGNSSSAGKRVASSSISTTPITKRIDEFKKQLIEGKLLLLGDDGKLLPKVVSTKEMKRDDDYNPYDDDVYDIHKMYDNFEAIYDELDITVHGWKKK
ncbi:hypothetical protein Tco_0517141 [Tanacetum coccineum]